MIKYFKRSIASSTLNSLTDTPLRAISSFYFSTQPNVKQQQIYKICLTGGPCAGKTTALSQLQYRLSQQGFRVFCVPEAATLLMKGGALINSFQFTFDQAVKFQTELMKTQMYLEDTFSQLAKNENLPSVIFCDRGLMDGSAYVNEELWQAVLDEIGLSPIQLRDKRYDAVVHMVTAADGAEQFYNKTNEARYESIQQAVEVDKRLRNAYLGHSRLFVVDNKNALDFNNKIDKCVDIVSKVIGMPSPTSYFKKFLIKIANPSDHNSLPIPRDINVDTFEVIETLLKPSGDDDDENGKDVEIYLRKRGKQNSFVYNQEIRYTSNHQRIQKQRIITGREYLELMQQKIPHLNTLKKTKSSFIYQNQAYMIETITNIEGQPTFLRVETSNEQIIIPPFIEVIRDVTSKKEYSSPTIAHVNYKYDHDDQALSL